MRNLPVIKELVNRGHTVTVVSGQSQIEITNQYLDGRASLVTCDTDAGLIVEPGTLKIDQEATKTRVREHQKLWKELIAMAPQADTYVVDIVPWALIAAKERNIPSYLMASFTWIDQYQSFIPADLVRAYGDAFLLADKVLYYDLVNQPTRNLLGNGIDVGFVARPFHEDIVASIREGHKRPIVFLSLGASNSGLDFDIDVSDVPYDFISTTALHLIGDNIQYLERSVQNTQDYIKAADCCITKAGWSTVSEDMLAGVPFAVLERNDSPEDIMTIQELKRRNAAISIKEEELKHLDDVLIRVRAHQWPYIRYSNNYQIIADLISEE